MKKKKEPYDRYRKSRCENCGAKPYLRQLDVHHVDGNHDNNSPANLRTLCRSCHRKAHKESGRVEWEPWMSVRKPRRSMR